jgi:hypothetical protein
MLHRVATVLLTFQRFPKSPGNSMQHGCNMGGALFLASRVRLVSLCFGQCWGVCSQNCSQEFGAFGLCEAISRRGLTSSPFEICIRGVQLICAGGKEASDPSPRRRESRSGAVRLRIHRHQDPMENSLVLLPFACGLRSPFCASEWTGHPFAWFAWTALQPAL